MKSKANKRKGKLNIKTKNHRTRRARTSSSRKGYYEKNDQDAYSLNNITAKRADDGSVAIQFGGCEGKIANCLPIMKGWNYMVRLYRPRKEILDGSWKFPEAQLLK